MTLTFKTSMEFYNDPALFLLQSKKASATTDDDELFIQILKFQLDDAVKHYNEKTLSDNDKITFIKSLIFASMNKYRIQHRLTPFFIGGVPTAVTQWHSEQRLTHSGESIVSVLSARPHHSANLGGISGKTVETNLFLRQTLGLTELIGHVSEYTAQDESLPDYVDSKTIWTKDELTDPENWVDYAADVVATIAGTWSGKSFLMQAYDKTLYTGINVAFSEDNELILDVLTSSTTPTIL